MDRLVGFYSSLGFKIVRKEPMFSLMLRKPRNINATKEEKVMSIKAISRQLSGLGIQHVVVSGAKYSEDADKFVQEVIQGLQSRAGESTLHSQARAAVLREVPRIIKQFDGKKAMKPLIEKLQSEFQGKTEHYDNVLVWLEKPKSGSARINFRVRYAQREQSEFSMYIRLKEDGGIDSQAILQSEKGMIDTVLKQAEANNGIDAKKLAPMLKEFYKLGTDISEHTGNSVTSFSGFIDFIYRI